MGVLTFIYTLHLHLLFSTEYGVSPLLFGWGSGGEEGRVKVVLSLRGVGVKRGKGSKAGQSEVR